MAAGFFELPIVAIAVREGPQSNSNAARVPAIRSRIGVRKERARCRWKRRLVAVDEAGNIAAVDTVSTIFIKSSVQSFNVTSGWRESNIERGTVSKLLQYV